MLFLSHHGQKSKGLGQGLQAWQTSASNETTPVSAINILKFVCSGSALSTGLGDRVYLYKKVDIV
jgi:hypothetical protein